MNTAFLWSSVLLASASCVAMRPGAVGSSSSETKDVHVVLSKTELDVTNNKLHFNAWVVGDSYAKARAVLRGPRGDEAGFDFTGDCNGVIGGMRTSYRTSNECGFDLQGDPPGTYQLTILIEGKQAAQLQFELHAVSLRPGGTSTLALDERGYVNTLHHNGMSMLYRHRMSPMDPVSQLQFVWLQGDAIVGVEQANAKGPELQYRPLPYTAVGVIAGGVPRKPKEMTEHTVMVFKDGRELLGTFAIPGGVYFHVDLQPTREPSAAIVAAAQEKALIRNNADAYKPQFIDVKYSESVACAVLTDDKAHRAFVDALRDSNSAHWAWYDAAVAHDTALDDRVTEAQRTKLKRRMVDKAKQRTAELESAKGNEGIVLRAAAKHPLGCLRTIAGAYAR